MYLHRVTQAVSELAKGMKSVSFYPDDHPLLIQAVTKILARFEEIPLPEEGLEIGITKNALLYKDIRLPGSGSGKALVDLNRELYLRRAARIIFLPNLRADEIVSFLKVVVRDAEQVADAGGLEQALLGEKVSHIWANKVDYDRLTELLKEDAGLPEVEPEELPPDMIGDMLPGTEIVAAPDGTGEVVTIETLLARIEKENDPPAYRGHIVEFSRFLLSELPERKLGYATRAMTIFARHIEFPPGGSREIAGLAAVGIKELASDELIDHYIALLKKPGLRGRRETETVLAALGEKAVNPLLQTLAEEKDLLVRKTIVSIVVRIGRIAVPVLLENLDDPRWYMVRNMVTILGSLDMPDLAPSIAATLSHKDLRVKKEAIKALARIEHPIAVTTLCDLCFFPEETVALSATAALSLKKDAQSVVALFRRATARKYIYPNYRLAHEAIDSLRSIGTDDAVTALEEILSMDTFWKTERFRSMKSHALRSISMIKGERAAGVLQKAIRSGDRFMRMEAERILKRRPLQGGAP
ncbi:MAG: HEAT repeat domain-containing protein [Thermodesulfobacteriota bacterium]